MRYHPLFAFGTLVLANQAASAARFEGQFDLVCEGKISKSGSPWNIRLSVDLGRGLFCTRKSTGECVQKPPADIARIMPSLLVLIDRQPEGENRRVLSVHSETDEVTLEIHKPAAVEVFARAACHREAFTPFPPTPAP